MQSIKEQMEAFLDTAYEVYHEDTQEDPSVGIFKAPYTDYFDTVVEIPSHIEGEPFHEAGIATKEEFKEKFFKLVKGYLTMYGE